jgi:asparagine synthase (glutamine-hydrolysing)
MCGILGIVSATKIVDSDWFEGGLDSIMHRGPDSFGIWWSNDKKVRFGHRRLSIIDLTVCGHQPMNDDSGNFTIIFNGEIYNFQEIKAVLLTKGYQFRSNSDTEVIINAYKEWGRDCVNRFNGAFAFAIYDKIQQTVFLARDRAGEKPLFYHFKDKTICFSSELKALLFNPKFNRVIRPEALDCYLSIGYVPGELCILQGFNKLPPAHAMSFDIRNGDLKIWRYWKEPDFIEETNPPCNESELIDELEVLMEDSVKKQLVSDVPLGILLSGGVDSSLITALASRAGKSLKTFTIRFPGHTKLDETSYARMIANHYNTDHIELEASPATSDLLHLLAKQFDEPIVDSSMIPTYLVSELVKGHCSVALGGDGGDELFGGYTHYDRIARMENKASWIPLWMRKGISSKVTSIIPVGYKGRAYVQSLGTDFKKDVPNIATYFDVATRENLMKKAGPWINFAGRIYQTSMPENSNLIQRATRLDFENYLPEDILVKVDRASMLNSLEIRAPFLDYRVIEFAFGKVPARLKVTGSSRKVLLKKLCNRILPSEFDLSRKQGFSIPLSEWLKGGSFRTLFEDVLYDPNCIFDKSMVASLFKGQDNGLNNGERLFSLTIFELWRREYSVSI